jgi:hypothetical protein
MPDVSLFARTFNVAAGACATLLAVGCATVSIPPPTDQIAVADAAVADAVAAGGPEYAVSDFRNAQRKLDRARDALALGEYVTARRYAEDAEVDARLAATRARSTKAVRAADEVQASIRALRDELARAPQ